MHPRAAVAVSLFVMRRGGLIDTRFVQLILRGRPPSAGLLAVPGGKIKLGEPIADAALRELREETGLIAELPEDPSFFATDAITRDNANRVVFHFSISHVLAYVRCDDDMLPNLRASSDASEAIWANTSDVIGGHLIGGRSCVPGTSRLVSRAVQEWKSRL